MPDNGLDPKTDDEIDWRMALSLFFPLFLSPPLTVAKNGGQVAISPFLSSQRWLAVAMAMMARTKGAFGGLGEKGGEEETKKGLNQLAIEDSLTSWLKRGKGSANYQFAPYLPPPNH